MYDLLVTFGDSWPYGAELKSHEKTYGKVLSENLQCKFLNKAIGGSCIDSMVLQLKDFLAESYNPNTKICALFFITSLHRALLFNPQTNEPRSIYPMENHEDSTIRNYFKYVHCSELHKFRANVAILALQKICKEYNIDDRYLIGWVDPALDYPGIDKQKIFPQSAVEILGASADHECSTNYQHRYFYPNTDHPNEAGHKVIADWILEHLH